MKRRFVLTVIIYLTVTSFLTSCSGESMLTSFFERTEKWYSYNEQAEASAKMDSILEAIKNKDRIAFSLLFSRKAVAEAKDFEQSITDLFAYCQGNFESYDDWGGPEGDETLNNGDKQKVLYSSYDVKTDGAEYRFAIQDFVVDTADEDNVGIHSLYVIKAEDDVDRQIGYRGDNCFAPGIHIGVKNVMPKEDASISAVSVED